MFWFRLIEKFERRVTIVICGFGMNYELAKVFLRCVNKVLGERQADFPNQKRSRFRVWSHERECFACVLVLAVLDVSIRK